MSVILETERILLRSFVMDDYKEVYGFGSDPEIVKYTGHKGLESYDEAKSIIENAYLSDYKKHGFGRWATIYKPDNKLIGFAGLKYLDEFDEVDIGYRFFPKYWGKGIATEISEAIIEYGFDTLNLKRIIGIADPENIASCKVLTKIGLKLYKKDSYGDDGKLYNYYHIEGS